MCTPGAQDDNNLPYTSAKVNATTSGVIISRWVITAVLVRCTVTTRDGTHCGANIKATEEHSRPHNAV